MNVGDSAPRSSRPQERFTFSRVLLSSGLTAGILGVLLSLLGLMFRVGYLKGFGVSPDLFLPESSAELSYWGYMAILAMWANVYALLGTAWFWSVILTGAALAIVWNCVGLALEGRTAKARLRLWRRNLRNSRWTQGVVGSAVALLAVSITPWVVVLLTAFVIGLPLEGYKSGKREADWVLSRYKESVAGQGDICAVLTGLREPASKCLLLIAQSKERMAFADGDQIRVVWSKDVEVSWTSRNAREQLNARDRAASDGSH